MNKTKKIKKTITTLIFLILFIILGNTKSNAGSLYLDNLNFDAKINQDGSMNVTETWDISISETNTLFKTFKTDNINNRCRSCRSHKQCRKEIQQSRFTYVSCNQRLLLWYEK